MDLQIVTGKTASNPVFAMYQQEPPPGDYYGVVYKGSMFPLILGAILVVGGLWYIIARSRKSRH